MNFSCSVSKHSNARAYSYSIPSEINGTGIDIVENQELSDLDKAYVFLNYPRKDPHSEAREWDIIRALNVAGVVGPRRDEILNTVSSDDQRDAFIRWNAARSRVKNNSPGLLATIFRRK